MKTMNKVILGVLTLLSSNFAFAQDVLDSSLSVGGNAILNILIKAFTGIILLVVIGLLISKCNSK
ncbi:hypothetical protein [Gilliamella apicola]|uniref:Uncharacterized protein n=1 Tax=Gilliamella apicola TaxID=1196095 RepID=A0A242NG09_9GAMM|nr:hypothetical protein [Gilliamella apicola]OTP82629.1 hypothetical protein B5S40_06330 [Gilliamella apicola]OTP85000.1 hypothetical protein B5S44_07555 [Gilliamella apicola]OTP98867.1 hypothetical protein B6D08_09530 [Gilliamella apicola]OTQ10560.1 hypothetical protein B6C91_05250 [Gilliamella apicola]OTQ16924.1 hypothetical protein B6D11_02970 [Gilliamella apicola]